jgi:pimeloyl-ACP methyl ester carboxylesterase
VEAFDFGDHWLAATAHLHDPHQGEGYFAREMLPGFQALTPATTIDLSIHALMMWELPVCIVHGAQDELFPVAVAEQMAHALPHAELHIVPNQGHALIFRANREVGEILRRFLAAHVDPA